MKLPTLCHHKRSNRAYSTDPATGKQIYFGEFGSQGADESYRRWIAALVVRKGSVASGLPAGSSVVMSLLLADYTAFVRKYYRKHGRETSEVRIIARNTKILDELFGTMDVHAFGPSHLKQFRQVYVDRQWSADSINAMNSKVCRMFRWAVENELARPEQLVALRAVRSLSPIRDGVKGSKGIKPVSADDVRKVAAVCKPTIRLMLLVHLACGCRTTELCEMAINRIDTSRDPWVYAPAQHKEEHMGKERLIYLGPEARTLMAPQLVKAERRHDGRLWVGTHGPHNQDSYADAVRRACDKAKVQRFRPLQIRHTAATLFRQTAGIEAAQALLGHAHLKTSEIYAEKLFGLAKEVIEKVG